MALIFGTEYCKIDSNGRFKLPNALKRQLEGEETRFIIRQGFTAECLELWPYASFQQEVETLRQRLNPYSIRDTQILRQMTRANIVELDSNDRMLIPPERKSVIGDSKEIVLQAIGDCIEIWGRAEYDKMNASIVDFAATVDKRLGEQNGISCASDAE